MRSSQTVLVSVLTLAAGLIACDRDFMGMQPSAGAGRGLAPSAPIAREEPPATPSAPSAELHGPAPSLPPPAEAIPGPEAPTAQDQPMTEAEAETTRLIREAVVDDASLSMGAQNVVIVTRGHEVTLRGDVGSDAERDIVEAHARAVEGVNNVDNRLAVRL